MKSLFDQQLLVNFILDNGVFSNGSNVKSCSGLRMSCVIEGDPPPKGISADVEIWGVNEADMNLIVMTSRTLVGSARMQIIAGDSNNEPAVAFFGTVFDCRINYNSQPNTSLYVHAFSLQGLKSIRTPPISYKTPVQAETLLEGLANSAGLSFENNGVHKEMEGAYLTGSVGGNIEQICKIKSINYNVENETLIIWDEKRNIPTPLINVANGLIGYPTATVFSINVSTYYNPNVRLGGDIQTETGIPQCDGEFAVIGLTHELSNQLPDGGWFTHIQSYFEFDVLKSGVK